MHIVSRPKLPSQLIGIGQGPNTLNLTDEQLQLVSTLLYHVRLGHGSIYRQAAYELIGEFDAELGEDFMNECCSNVNLQVTIEDSMGGTMKTDSSHQITLEV